MDLVAGVAFLNALAAIERAGERLGIRRCALEAAALAVVSPRAEVANIEREFNAETASAFGELRLKGQYSRVVLEAMAAYDGAHGNDGTRDAAIAVVAAEVEVAPTEDQAMVANSLRLMISSEERSDRSAFLEELSEQLDARETVKERAEQTNSQVLSISIDICGSTHAKTRMRARARGDDELTSWYREFHRQFLVYEWQFYESVFCDGGLGAGLDWKRAFVVKGIGDEVWLLYEIVEGDVWDLAEIAIRLLDGALDMLNQHIFWTSAQDGDDGCDTEDSECERLPFKVYIDLIEDAFEISIPRLEFLSGRMARLIDGKEAWRDKDFVEVGNRLNAGTLMADGRRLLSTTRTDYIGWEIDRFFRATKYAVPCATTVGRNLFERILKKSETIWKDPGGSELRRAVVEVPRDEGGVSRSCDRGFLYVARKVDPCELKGVDEAYRVYRVVREHELFGLHQNGLDKVMMKPTLDVFSCSMVEALRKIKPVVSGDDAPAC